MWRGTHMFTNRVSFVKERLDVPDFDQKMNRVNKSSRIKTGRGV